MDEVEKCDNATRLNRLEEEPPELVYERAVNDLKFAHRAQVRTRKEFMCSLTRTCREMGIAIQHVSEALDSACEFICRTDRIKEYEENVQSLQQQISSEKFLDGFKGCIAPAENSKTV